LISQGGLGDLDDSLLSSSADSDSYDESDSSQSAPKSNPDTEINNHAKIPSPRYDTAKKSEATDSAEHLEINDNHHHQQQQQQDESLFSHNLDQTAALTMGNHLM